MQMTNNYLEGFMSTSNFGESFKGLIRAFSNIHHQGDKKNIFLFSTPRGGSTWVMEILSSQPGMKYYDEPFSIRRPNVQKVSRFKKWEDLMPEAEREEDIIQYLRELSNNKIGVMNPTPFRKYWNFYTKRIVFKIHELEHLINPIKEKCNGQILYLLRHPIPTSLSRNVLPRLDLYLNSDFYTKKYLTPEKFIRIKNICETGSKLEQGVIAWCLENILPLKYSDTSDWLFVTYEELLLKPYTVCHVMADKLELEREDLMLKAVDVPSVNIDMSGTHTKKILQDRDTERRRIKMFTKWKNTINDGEEERCFEIMDLFKIDAYTYNNYFANARYLHDDTTLKWDQNY